MSGVVLDQTGGVLVAARVELLLSSNSVSQTLMTDSAGAFKFDAVPSGTYSVRASLDGFRTTTVRVTVGATSPRPLRVTLPLASVEQSITVSNVAEQVSARAGK